MKIKLRPGRLPEDLPLTHPASLIATWFGVGLAPLAAGTWGSLAALPIAAVIVFYFGLFGLFLALCLTTLIGTWAASVMVSGPGRAQDPGFIVVDEVAAMFLTLLFAPFTWSCYALAFLLFRIADVFKPFPANWSDRNIHGGIGVMLDDLIAGLYAGIATWLLSGYANDVAQRFIG
jgi:phosphatidylglycerophosphatase A